MISFNTGSPFLKLVRKMLEELGFKVTQNTKDGNFIPDLLIEKAEYRALVDIKFYRSSRVNPSIIYDAARLLASCNDFLLPEPNLLLICSGIVSEPLRAKIKKDLGVIVWDRANIFAFTETTKGNTFENFYKFLIANQQGTVVEEVVPVIDGDIEKDPLAYFSITPPIHIDIEKPKATGLKLIAALEAIEPGYEGSRAFENVGEEILKYLFNEDISVWKQQLLTEDELSKFDLIGRIGSADEFWKSIVASFRSRYVIFEFKNYSDKITQNQIYLTERYLFPHALRGTAIVITRKGATAHAEVAAAGALRESGKLILILDDDDLKEMLRKRDDGNSPNDYLSEKLDELLMSFSR